MISSTPKGKTTFDEINKKKNFFQTPFEKNNLPNIVEKLIFN